MVLTHSDRCKRGASFIEGKMRKHSDHETESDEANNMSWLMMLKCGKYIALLVVLLTKWQKRTKVPSECQSREKRGKACPRRCTVKRLHRRDMSLIQKWWSFLRALRCNGDENKVSYLSMNRRNVRNKNDRSSLHTPSAASVHVSSTFFDAFFRHDEITEVVTIRQAGWHEKFCRSR